MPDLYGQLGKRLGIEFEFVDAPCAEVMRRARRGDGIDVVGAVGKERAEKSGFLTPQFRLSSSFTLFARVDNGRSIAGPEDLAGSRLAVVGGLTQVRNEFPELRDSVTVVAAETPIAAFNLLRAGHADFMLGFNHDAYTLMRNTMPEQTGATTRRRRSVPPLSADRPLPLASRISARPGSS